MPVKYLQNGQAARPMLQAAAEQLGDQRLHAYLAGQVPVALHQSMLASTYGRAMEELQLKDWIVRLPMLKRDCLIEKRDVPG